MKSLIIFSIVVAATAAQAEIICTHHGGCTRPGMKLIYGDGRWRQPEQHNAQQLPERKERTGENQTNVHGQLKFSSPSTNTSPRR